MKRNSGFTLIELSIVLVIIGLIVGGVLVGRDLIAAATIRAQISQVEKYQQAVNTFQGKYDALPGDIPAALVSKFGFTAAPTRSGTIGHGDGNGELDGGGYAWNQEGENLFFWNDLSTNSHLIEGNYTTADNVAASCSNSLQCAAYFPYAKIGRGNFLYVYSGYSSLACCTGIGPNFMGLNVITSIGGGANVSGGGTPPTPGLTVSQAYTIDKKIDDGIPTTGKVLAQYLGPPGINGQPYWSAFSASASASTCYDTSSANPAYSMSQNNGSGINCGISFQIK